MRERAELITPLRRPWALKHLRVVEGAVDLPVNADFEGGFAVDPEQVNANVKLAAATGVAGLSIEDSTGDHGSRCMTSIWPLSVFGRRAGRSMTVVRASFCTGCLYARALAPSSRFRRSSPPRHRSR